jgi:tetratricopeptide (TPR) repeat protein
MLTPKLGNHPNEKKKKVILFAVLALVFLLVLSIDTETPLEKIDPGSQVKYDLNEISPSVLNAVERKKNNQNKELSSQTVVITKRGLRELREKNYFRAISEFSHAIDINPNDAQANFYMRRAKDELDSAIKQFNINAVRDMESLQYKKAIVSYCAVVRLLYNYPEDERFKAAEVNITKIEEKLGYEKGEVQCIQK